MRIILVLALAIVLVAPALPVGAGYTNACATTTPFRCTLAVSRTVIHGSWWTHAFDTPSTIPPSTQIQLLSGSFFEATAWYVTHRPEDTTGTDTTQTNRSAVLLRLERHVTGVNPVLVAGAAVYVEGAHLNVLVEGDSPVAFHHEIPSLSGPPTWAGLRVRMGFDGVITVAVDTQSGVTFGTTVPGPVLTKSVTYRLVAMAPDAYEIDTSAVLVTATGQQLVSTDTRRTQCGSSPDSVASCNDALYTYRNWTSGVKVRTQGAELLQSVTQDFTVANRIYGFVGPATVGRTYVDAGAVGVVFGASDGTWGRTRFNIVPPSGPTMSREFTFPVCTLQTCSGGTQVSNPVLLAQGPAGTWTFNVVEHEAFGVTPDFIAMLTDIVPAT